MSCIFRGALRDTDERNLGMRGEKLHQTGGMPLDQADERDEHGDDRLGSGICVRRWVAE